MKIDEILYTPLDCPQQPFYLLDDIKNWANRNIDILCNLKEQLNDEFYLGERFQPNYPWNVQVVYRKFTEKDLGWVRNFDIEFPELSKYFYEAFGLKLDDLGIVLMLPVKENHTGIGFWHQDPDMFGLRMYLEYEQQKENTLLIRSLNDKQTIKKCIPVSNKQCFFLNNKIAEHTTYTEIPNKTRIAVLIIGKLDEQSQQLWKQKITYLVENSAKKFIDNVVL